MNQDRSCFVVGTTVGFAVYRSDPLALVFKRDFGRGIGVAALYYQSNIVALVGGGPIPQFSPQKVRLWDDLQGKSVSELQFGSDVKNVLLLKDIIVVTLETKLHFFRMSNLQQLREVETFPNPLGVCTVTYTEHPKIAYVGKTGKVKIEEVLGGNLCELPEKSKTPVNNLSFSADGTLLVTTTEHGSEIRVWNGLTGVLVKKLRRGSSGALIHSVNFSHHPESYLLAVTSNLATCHIFSTGEGNCQSKLSYLQAVSNYFTSEWSFLHFTAPSEKSLVFFGAKRTSLIIITVHGRYMKYNLTSPMHGAARDDTMLAESRNFFDNPTVYIRTDDDEACA
eukprot:TRINITY_DN2607_c0_g1_i1.p1 TRINITY_DN2607_c0_g1~~TRINITY_DN2607_c0_g1_i1.p1  ORF type:complete len:337 (-),score=58.81 TRINITY_DN2607_c0_g1_i1:132-1142(-)